MNPQTILRMILLGEAAWGLGLLVLLALRVLRRQLATGAQDGDPLSIRAATLDALTTYLGGNRELSRLKALAAGYPQEVEQAIVQCQTSVGDHGDELCELAVILGFVDDWCHEARSSDLAIRRRACAHLAQVAHYPPVHRLMGLIPDNALSDPDEEIRLEAARILLASGEPDRIARVFHAVVADTAGMRVLMAMELGRHSEALCRNVVPEALRSSDAQYLVSLLRLLAAWERALPIADLSAACHPDPAVRVEVMRLLPLVPKTHANRNVLASGLTDENPQVREMAALAASRSGLAGVESGPLEPVGANAR